MIKVVLVKPGKSAEALEIPNTLKAKQEIVGGDIEVAYPFADRAAIICNENSVSLENCMPNRGLRDRNGALYSILFGDFMIAGLSDDNFCSLSEEQMKYYLQAYQNPELFCIDRDTGKVGIVRSSQFPSREEFDHCYDKLLANGEMAAVKELLR